MPSLSDMVQKLESNFGAANASQPASMVNPTFGQYSGFVNQYGSGSAGVNNFASQVLAANPNATVGDFYAKYVLGTGNPASSIGIGDLQSTTVPGAQGAYNNLVNNSPIDPNAPLANYVPGAATGSNIPDGVPQGGQGFNFGNVDTAQVSVDNNQFFGAPAAGSFDERFNAINPNANVNTGLFSDPTALDPSGQQFSQDFSPGSFSLGDGATSSATTAQPQATIAQAAASGGPAGTAASTYSGDTSASGSTSGDSGGQGATGSGIQIAIGPQPGLTQLATGIATQLKDAVGSMTQTILTSVVDMVSKAFGITGDLFVRGALIVLGVIIIAVALVHLMGGPSPQELVVMGAHAVAA